MWTQWVKKVCACINEDRLPFIVVKNSSLIWEAWSQKYLLFAHSTCRTQVNQRISVHFSGSGTKAQRASFSTGALDFTTLGDKSNMGATHCFLKDLAGSDTYHLYLHFIGQSKLSAHV